MPNNENGFNELPNLNNDNENQNNNQTPAPVEQQSNNNPLIEIPKEFYEKVAEEQHNKAIQEQQEAIALEESHEANKRLGKIFIEALVCCAIVFGGLHVAFKSFDKAIFLIPIVTAILTIFSSASSKKESTFHTAVLVGGMIAAVISYVMGVVNKESEEYWMHFALVCAIASFVCAIVCAIIHNFIANRENIKALGTIGIVLFFVGIIGIPYYLYQKNPEEIYRQVFMKTTEVKAETEFEFITKTLKNRYNIEFECQNKKVKVDVQKGRRISQRTCIPNNNKEISVTVQSLAYDEGKNQYIVMDNYLDLLKFNDFRLQIAQDIMEFTGAKSVNVYVYPKENCTFIGDCAPNEDYYKNYEKIVDVTNQYNASSKANYEKYVSMDAKDIVNSGEYMYVINIVSLFTETVDFSSITNNVLKYLNTQGLKNNFGFEITLTATNRSGDSQKQAYKVKGETNSEKTFKDAQVVTKE